MKLKLRILSSLSLILLVACSQKVKYESSGCLIFPEISISETDKATLNKYQDELSYEFLYSLRNYKDIRKKECLS